jgi:histidinol phosphatase-like PHP family hydrolase
MEVMEYGVATAQRAWLTAEDVINTRPLDQVLGLLKDTRA